MRSELFMWHCYFYFLKNIISLQPTTVRCQNWKVSELENFRTGKCQNWKPIDHDVGKLRTMSLWCVSQDLCSAAVKTKEMCARYFRSYGVYPSTWSVGRADHVGHRSVHCERHRSRICNPLDGGPCCETDNKTTFNKNFRKGTLNVTSLMCPWLPPAPYSNPCCSLQTMLYRHFYSSLFISVTRNGHERHSRRQESAALVAW